MATYRAFYISGPGASWKDKLRLAALAVVGGAILVAALILSLGLALVLIPIGVVAYLFRRQLLRALVGSVQRRQQAGSTPERPANPADRMTIDAEYTIVEPDTRPRR